MKFSFRLWLCILFVCLGGYGWAQGFEENALLFSRTKPGGSARIQALGGAQVALGGDYSSALSNPAGLGFYNRSEITFSPALNAYNTESNYLGNKESDSKNTFNIPGLSLVYHYPVEKGKFLGGSFAISMTRVNDFNNVFQYSGTDNASSIIDSFIEEATGKSIYQLPSPYQNTEILPYDVPVDLAYRTYLINPNADQDPYPSPFTEQDYYDYTHYFSELDTLPGEIRNLNRSGLVKTKGAQYQWSFSYGGNYADKLFFGASLGFTSLRYEFSNTYSESGYTFSTDPDYDPLNNLQMKESITIDGSGVNLTLGLIYRPIDYVQLGISLVTPTYYDLSDSYTATLSTQWNDARGVIEESSLDPIVSDYTLTTPLKFTTGAVFFFGKRGFITGDVEFINYGKAKYDSDVSGVSFNSFNKNIDYYYTNVINYRFGAEFRHSIYRLRGGYAIQNNPYNEQFGVDRSIKTISLGAGVKLTRFSIDFAWLTSKGESSFSPYVFQNGTGPVANLSNTMASAMLTVGYTF